MTDTAHDYTTWDAPYVLGSLTRTERREYEEHLAHCPACQASVAELAGVPGMLALVDSETALAMIAPMATGPEATGPEPNSPVPELLPRLADAAQRRRRRSRWVSVGAAVAAAAAAVAIAVPVVYSVASSNTTSSSDQVIAERAMQPLKPTPISASFKLVAAEDKTRIVMTCSYGASDQKYNWKFALFVLGTDGKQTELDQWPAGPGTQLTIDRTVDAAPDQIQSVEIRSVATGERVLVGTV
ncbi:anti-sigma factor family protein [Nocardia sp. GCM10030253]|uniref:anti-sigma factor family protein n=1 Tax=Nocardia sp. GCM10030253 TaxID=3273404 RepID=UPI00362DDA18